MQILPTVDASSALTSIAAAFEQNGFVIIRNFWPEALIGDFERGLNNIYYRQALKISDIRNKFKNTDPMAYDSVKNFDVIMQTFEKEDKEAAYQVLRMIEASPIGMKFLIYERLLAVASKLLRVVPDLLTLNGPHPFVNLPNSKRLLYRWHAENCYYPKRRNFLNLWSPIFRNKSVKNGTMYFALGSQKIRDQQFVEYYGFDKETHGRKNHFLQYEIPESELTEYKKFPVVANRRDLVIFDRCMAHTSTINQTQAPSYAVVMRIFNFNDDLTLSGNPSAHPYSGQANGRPGLRKL